MNKILLVIVSASLLGGCLTSDNKYPHRTGYDKYIPKEQKCSINQVSGLGIHDHLIPQTAYKAPNSSASNNITGALGEFKTPNLTIKW